MKKEIKKFGKLKLNKETLDMIKGGEAANEDLANKVKTTKPCTKRKNTCCR